MQENENRTFAITFGQLRVLNIWLPTAEDERMTLGKSTVMLKYIINLNFIRQRRQ